MESMAGTIIGVLVSEDVSSGDRDHRHLFSDCALRSATDREASWARRQIGLDPNPETVEGQINSIRLAFAKILAEWAQVPVDPTRIEVTAYPSNWGESHNVSVGVTPPTCEKK